MPLDSVLEDLGDSNKRLSSSQLATLSELDTDDAHTFEAAFETFDVNRRFSIVQELIELAQDNVDLNFDAVFKIALRDDEAAVRAAALRGLYEYESRDIIPTLIDVLLTDPDADVRREGAIALGRFALACELGQYSSDETRRIREALIESAEDLDEDERVRARAIEALGALSGEDTDNLIESIYDEESLWLKVGAVDAMGRSANGMWLPVLMRETENRAPEMRHAAAFALGEIGEEEAVPRLRRMAVEDPDREVQIAAVHAMGEIGGANAKVALQGVLYEGDEALEEAVQEALSEIAFNEDPLGSL
jgi:HEAT repeat protein